MRKFLTIMNSLAGMINKIVSLIFVFWVRWYFIRYLDKELLGLEGLFANILGVFSLVDVGIGTAISFSLFKPIHENNRSLVGAIMKFYKKVYTIIGLIVIGLSVLITSVIPFLIKGVTIDHGEIRIFFLIYAFSVGISYFFAYKRTLLFALQKNYKVLYVDTFVKIFQSLVQIYSIIVFKSYLLYLASLVIFAFLGNVICSFIANKENAYDVKELSTLPIEFRNNLYSNVRSLAVTNISWIGINSTDNIIISAFVGVLELAKNTNYSTVVNSLVSLVAIVLGGVSASIGDLLAENNIEKSKQYFTRYTFIYQAVAAYACVGFICASKPLIQLWAGEEYIFDVGTVLIIAINLFLILIFKPLADYQNYAELFKYYQPYSVAAFVINILFSIVLALHLGILGVFLGTTITYIFMIISVTRILYKYLFHEKEMDYLFNFLKTVSVIILATLMIEGIDKILAIDNLVIGFAFKIVAITIVYVLIFSLMFIRDETFHYFCVFTKKMLFRRKLK